MGVSWNDKRVLFPGERNDSSIVTSRRSCWLSANAKSKQASLYDAYLVMRDPNQWRKRCAGSLKDVQRQREILH